MMIIPLGLVHLPSPESDSEKTFEVDIKGDNTPEFDEILTVSLSNVTSGAIISTTKGSAKGTITNDDGSELTIEDARLLEGADGDKNKMMFTRNGYTTSNDWIFSTMDDFKWNGNSYCDCG